MKKLLLVFATITLATIVFAQSPQLNDCTGADDLNITGAFMSGGPTPEDTAIDYGCVVASAQHTWFGYFTVCDSGTLTISSTCGAAWDDVDLVVWRPFTTTAMICAQLNSTNIAACSATGTLAESVNVGFVNQGEIYMVAAVCDTDFIVPSYVVNGTADVTGACPGPPLPNGPGCALGAVDLNQFPMSGLGSVEDTTIDYGCVIATGQYMWYGYFTVCQGGSLSVSSSVSTSAIDDDITVWGPFSSTVNLCTQLTAGMIAGCGASAGNDVVNLGTVTYGQVYMVAIACDTSLQIPYFLSNGTADITGTCTPPPPCAPINGYEIPCVVTVDSATQEYQLIWNEVSGNPVEYFGIMRNDFMNAPQQIDTVHITSLSQYIDVSADPGVHHETYSIIVYDTCGTTWTNGGYYIRPVFCQSSLSTQGTVNVSWTDYLDAGGNGPVYYVIYRGSTPANMVSMDTVSYSTTMWTDVNPPAGMSYYKIGVALYSACIPMRLTQQAASVPPVASYSNAAPITVVGIGENSLQEVSLFPNPSDGNITVKNLKASSIMKVYDLAGRIVVQQQLQPNGQQMVSLENLESGIYSLTIENETGFFREEVVIRH